MNSSLSLRAFFFLIFGVFLFTWIGLVVLPWVELGHLQPIKDDTTGNLTPWDAPGAAHQGELVYASNGCVYCHTQQVRPLSSGADITRGWGTATDDGDDKKTVIRRTYPRDYIWQHATFLGNSRNGADLANVAHRFTTASALYSYLYNPYVLNPHSSMPAYKYLFTTQKISGAQADDALVLTGKDAPAPGYEVVPTDEARALVAYLLSLNKGYHLPDEKGAVAAAPAKS
jgi:cytochrome c oxidase cbb3-type subunit 2